METSSLEPSVQYQVSRTVTAGRIRKFQDGTPGTIRRTYRVSIVDGHRAGKELVKEERTEPKPAVFLIGKDGFTFSRGNFQRHRVLTMDATAYWSMVCGTGVTATGQRAKFGVVAVDPRVIPLGSIVYVEGYGLALACDTGGAIKGNRIDLCYESRAIGDSFGHRMLKVHILR